jgi:hypothetical protein
VTPLAVGVEAPWIAAKWGKRPGYARRFHRQPFRWTTLYDFIPDDGEGVVLSAEVLDVGVRRPARRAQELEKRKGPVFHAVCQGRRGVACVIAGGPFAPSVNRWDFLGEDGVLRIVSDLSLEVFQVWGDPGAFNVWKGRLAKDARKSRREKAYRTWYGRTPRVEPNDDEE